MILIIISLLMILFSNSTSQAITIGFDPVTQHVSLAALLLLICLYQGLQAGWQGRGILVRNYSLNYRMRCVMQKLRTAKTAITFSILLLIMLCFFTGIANSYWYIEPIGSTGVEPSIALDSFDNPHISFGSGGEFYLDLKYAKWGKCLEHSNRGLSRKCSVSMAGYFHCH
jgi:hypothetical protein